MLIFIKKKLPLKTNYQAASNLRIECSGVPSFLDSQDFFDPRYNFVGAGVGRLIEIDDSVFEIFFETPLKRGGAGGNGRVVS